MGLSALSARQRRIVILVAALLAAAGTARLGAWQLDRAAQKQAMQGRLDERSHLPAARGRQMVLKAAPYRPVNTGLRVSMKAVRPSA